MPSITYRFYEALYRLGRPVWDLWKDAHIIGDSAMRTKDAERKQMALRAFVMTSGAALEAMTNFVASEIVTVGHIRNRPLTEFQMDCLAERRRVLENGEVRERAQIYSAKSRFLLLYSLLAGGSAFPAQHRAKLDLSFSVRDRLLHPKPGAAQDLKVEDQSGFHLGGLLLFMTWKPEVILADLNQEMDTESEPEGECVVELVEKSLRTTTS